MYKTIGNKIKYIESLDSTNNYLKSFDADHKPVEGFLVCAKEQFAGRGQRENNWESQVDKNLLISYITYPTFLKVENQFLLSITVSLAICELISQYTNNVSIKWPNDIYVANNKIAGVLIENTIKGSEISNSIIGIGININQENFSNHIPNPTSLAKLTKKTHNINALLFSLVEKLNVWHNHLLSGKTIMMNKLYTNNLFRYNEFHNYMVDDKKIKAKIIGIDHYGKLIIETKNNSIRTFAFKEIKYCI